MIDRWFERLRGWTHHPRQAGGPELPRPETVASGTPDPSTGSHTTLLAPPRVGHSLAVWGPDGACTVALAAYGESGPFRFEQIPHPRPGTSRVHAFWGLADKLSITAGLDALDVRSWYPDSFLRTGHADFDAQIAVRGEPRAWVKRYLDEDTRRLLLDLAWLGGGPRRRRRMRLEASGVRVTLTCARLLGDDARLLDRFLTPAVALLRRLRESPDLYLSVVGAGEIAEEAHCPVCGEGIAGRLIRCASCRTYHHAECFEYARGCATYACRSTRGVLLNRPRAGGEACPPGQRPSPSQPE